MRAVTAIALLALCAPALAASSTKSTAAHRRWVCEEIRKTDLLLYDEPAAHAPTTVCSYTDERLLIRANRELPPDRMKRFVFVAFLQAGRLSNDDFMMPPRIYVGYGPTCQSLTIDQAALLQRDARTGGESGMFRSYSVASSAPAAPCPR